MLTADLVRTRRRGGRLELMRAGKAARERMLEMATRYAEIAAAGVGHSREAFVEACADAEATFRATDRRVALGLQKLVLDRCDFRMEEELDPPSLRRALFERASDRRRELGHSGELDRDAIVAEVATAQGVTPSAVERALYADLKAAHLLAEFDAISAARLVEVYDRAQEQAVLLRATRVTVHLRGVHAAGCRRFFNTLKFRRLLFSLTPLEEGGVRVEIDGPMSLFRSVTKYGLQLALLLPALEEVGAWSLDAEVRWGRDREPLAFHLEGGEAATGPDASAPPHLSDELTTLVKRFEALDSGWAVEPAEAILDLPGEGLCVPDLRFWRHGDGAEVFLEVMGFWSRDAVWRRVELVEAGLPHRVVFAVSERLRVSEAALGADHPGALYVYKGTMSARAVLERIERVAL